jgi:4-amino-4-deoxy-L-arabinose transferase-like glycosyltransferase
MTTPDGSFPPQFGWSESTQRRVVHALLGLYVLGFCLLWPNALLISDEVCYVGQAILFARGEATQEVRQVLEGTSRRVPLSKYPIGTSALQAPFVKLGGWRLASLPSLFAIVGTVLVLLKWLTELRRPPIFALLPLLFVGTLVQGRLAMSDGLTALVSALTFWLFSRGERGGRFAWVASGFFAGLSAVFRDPTPLLYAPLFAGTVVRRERRAWQLLAGGVLGVAIRFISYKLLFGSALFLHAGVPVSLGAVPPNLLLYGFILICAIPLGLPSVFLHRSERKPELILGVLAVLTVYLLFPLPHMANSLVRDVVLHARYCTALVPLMAVTLAEWIPRWLAGRDRFQRTVTAGVVMAAAVLILSVHIFLYSWGRTLERITKAIYSSTPEGSVLLINPTATGKFMCEAFGRRDIIFRTSTTPGAVAQFVSKGESVYAVFVDRTDTEFRRQDAADNTVFLKALQERCRVGVLHDAQESAIERVRVAHVTDCGAGP